MSVYLIVYCVATATMLFIADIWYFGVATIGAAAGSVLIALVRTGCLAEAMALLPGKRTLRPLCTKAVGSAIIDCTVMLLLLWILSFSFPTMPAGRDTFGRYALILAYVIIATVPVGSALFLCRRAPSPAGMDMAKDRL